MRDALALLLQGFHYSQQLRHELWDFAVNIQELLHAGLTQNDLRWLVSQGYVEIASEITTPDSDRRQFRASGRFAFNPTTCFVLTGAGVLLAEASCVGFPEPLVRTVPFSGRNGGAKTREGVPEWDYDRREIRLEGRLVKRFRLPSPNQEIILAVFEEQGWPPRIDDPLPHRPDQEPKRRLHDTIRSLNRNQKERRIRFKGDGTGQGILWELVDAEETND